MNVLIIEDEQAASKRLKNLIVESNPHFNIVDIEDSVESAVHWFNTHENPDLIFMDIHLADGLSFEILEKVKVNSPIIFTTAYDQYAIKAFKVNSIDYLLKPIKKEELQKSITKFEKIKENASDATIIDYKDLVNEIKKGQKTYQERIVVKYGQKIKAVEIDQIAYFYTEEKIVFLFTDDGQKYAIDYNLDQLESILNPQRFFRINRQFIVNIRSIKEMFTYSKSRVKLLLHPPTKLDTIVSTDRSSKFKNWLSGGS